MRRPALDTSTRPSGYSFILTGRGPEYFRVLSPDQTPGAPDRALVARWWRAGGARSRSCLPWGGKTLLPADERGVLPDRRDIAA